MTTLATQDYGYLAFDSDLPSIAAMAAAEVDDLLREEETDLTYLAKLSEIIAKPLYDHSGTHDVALRLLDPVSTNVMIKSIAEFRGAPLQSFDELVSAICDLNDEISKVKDRNEKLPGSRSFLIQLKQFCLSLSRYALASKDQIDTFAGAPDYKR